MRLPLLQRPAKNAWVAADRRERLKLAAATLVLFGSILGGVLFVVYALAAG